MRLAAVTALAWLLPAVFACAGREPHGAPCVAVTPAALTFADAEVACRGETRLVVVRNDCPEPVDVSVAPLAGDAFHLVSTPGALLSPGTEAVLEIAFRPGAPGPASERLVVEAGPGVHEVSLSGRGAALAWREESWVVPETPSLVDLILVVDDGAALAPLAEAVRGNLDRFALVHVLTGASLRLGVLSASTASAEYGRWRTTPAGDAWFDEPSRSEFLLHATPRGDQPGAASCLGALLAARESGALAAFRRPGARVDVVCLTAQRDAWPQAWTPAYELVRAALVDPVRPWRASLSVVARFHELPGGCGAVGSVDDGRLRTFATLGGGVTDDLCAPNWASTLENVYPTHGWYFFTTFFLAGSPDPARAPLECRVDDVVLPAPGPGSWSWRPEENALSLSPLLAPAPGSVVRLRYAPACP